MKKGQIYEGRVEAMHFPNKGIVTLEETGESCIVKNVLPGQKIKFAVTRLRKGRGEGRLLMVLEPSPEETDSPCPHFGSCGGCTYLSLPYDKQLKLKERQVKELLDGVLAGQEPPYRFEGIKESPEPFGYRNKMEFTFGDEVKDGPLALGMHRRGSFYDIVTVRDCRIVDEDYRRILNCTLNWFAEKKLPYYHRLQHRGYLRHLLVRKGKKTGEILTALVTTSQEEADLRPWAEELLKLPVDGRITGILHIRNDSLADVVRNDRTELLYGQDYLTEELLGLCFRITPFSFFQTNSLGAEVLYETARGFIGDLGARNSVVFDLYSGTGTIAQLLAPVSKKVIGVEIVEEAVQAARENAAQNGLDNCEFIAGDVLKVLDEIDERPDFIVLDPPRDGIHPKALPKIIAFGVERLLYISCKPTSLARDLATFLDSGYRVERAVAVDQFPWTANIETIVLLSNKSPDCHM